MMFANATTSTGRMRGRIEDGLAVFRGIPFAQPPVGEHRFATPRPALPWDGVRDAFAFGPQPPQTPMGPSMPVVPEVSTDWLAVNVWPSHSRREASSGYLTFDTLPLL